MSVQKKLGVFKEVYFRARLNNYPVVRSFWYFFKYAKFGKYSPTEIFMTDLLDPTITQEVNKGMISAESFLEYEKSVNPRSHLHLTEDKVKFHDFCMENNLPVPETVASVDVREGSFWKKDDPIKSEKELIDGLSKFPFDLICKPTEGAHGVQVTNLHYIDGKHVLVDHPEKTLDQFIKSLFAETRGGYIIQKKLYSHQAIADFTGNPMLQTMRIETYLDENNQAHILGRRIKFPDKGSTVDNFVYGTSKNRSCIVNEDGVVFQTYTNCPQKQCLVRYDYLLNTEGEREDLQIPYWPEAMAMVLKAQALFSPLKTIGWDVAITDDGPILIEGNSYWDPYIRLDGLMGGCLERLGVPTEQVWGINRYKIPNNS